MEMDLFFQSLPFLALAVLLPLSLTIIFLFIKHKPTDPNLPPGKMGWPIVGETLEFLYMSRKGKPEKFIFDRTSKFSQEVFKTSLLGDNMAVFCTPTGNKFLFMNENKLVTSWWPRSFEKLFMSTTTHDKVSREGVKMRGMLPGFLKPEAIQKYIPIMDTLARDHLDNIWSPQKEVKVFDHAKKYTFALACKLFLSVDDPKRISVFAQPFAALTAGLMSLPIDLPGTAFNRAIKGAQFIRKLLLEIVRQRKKDLAEKKEFGVRDLLTHMLLATDEDGKHMNEVDIADKIIGLLIGGHDTASTALTFIMLYLADLPHIYNEVYKEQMEIANSKRPDELLNWEDIQKMKYSWNVACEAIRLAPPAQGGFRQAMHDFTYNGFTIPKGWKTYWTVHTTNKNPKYFPDPEKFDPTRFEGAGPAPYTYVPFGGGPRMCPGKEYARMEILVFMYNLVRKFKWEKLDPQEKIIHDPTPIPVNGLPVRLIPHNI